MGVQNPHELVLQHVERIERIQRLLASGVILGRVEVRARLEAARQFEFDLLDQLVPPTPPGPLGP